MKKDRLEIYIRLVEKYQNELQKQIRKSRFLGISRGLLFAGLILTIIFIWPKGLAYLSLSALVFIIPFLIFVKLNVSVNLKVAYLKELISINENEVSGLKGDFSAFSPGNEFINPDHRYSYDLDIFGNESIYQMINRSSTKGGSDLVKESLENQNLSVSKILKKQAAIKELSALLEWRQNFNATGNLMLETSIKNQTNEGWFRVNSSNYKIESNFHEEMIEWLASPFSFITNKFLKFLLILSPTLSIFLFILMITGIIPIMAFILPGLVQLLIIVWNLKKINKIHTHIGRKAQILKKYGSLLDLIEKQSFTSELLVELKNISGIQNKTASKSLIRLQSLANALDNRLNIFFAIFANAYLLWDLQLVIRIEDWRQRHINMLPNWLEVIYQFDALSGFANFSFNNVDYCFPQIQTGEFFLNMVQAGHPLIPANTRVNNDLKIKGFSQLLVLTGANMAGKSTFLRTVGVNMVLAMAGSTVCARQFNTSLVGLHTSIRASDSVQKNESYFFAELKRLKTIMDRIKSGEQLFIIIDEMLRGTNSKDKHLGSEALIEQLIRLNGTGILATHDISLGDLATKYPENVNNYRFEVEIKENELIFDYILKTGISQNLNATFLMKKMGITL